jgi:fatty acid desaturase
MNVRLFIAVVVTLVWGAGYVAAIASNGEFSPDISVNAVMLLVAGYFFSSGIKKGPKE